MPAEVFAGQSLSQLGAPVHITVCQDTVMMELLLHMYCLYTIDITGARFSNVRYNRMCFATICICMYTYIRYKGMFHSNIPLTGPLKVTGLSVTESVGGGNLNVSWSTPQSELPITEYTVEYRTSDMEQWSSHAVSPPSNSILLTGLNAGAGYSVRVRAVSVIGDGAWSKEIMKPDDSECLWSML